MLFTIINSENKPLSGRGYEFLANSKRITDYEVYEEIINQKGIDYAEGLTRRFYEEKEPICIGEDEVFYSVLFENVAVGGEEEMPKPVMWQEITLIGLGL